MSNHDSYFHLKKKIKKIPCGQPPFPSCCPALLCAVFAAIQLLPGLDRKTCSRSEVSGLAWLHSALSYWLKMGLRVRNTYTFPCLVLPPAPPGWLWCAPCCSTAAWDPWGAGGCLLLLTTICMGHFLPHQPLGPPTLRACQQHCSIPLPSMILTTGCFILLYCSCPAWNCSFLQWLCCIYCSLGSFHNPAPLPPLLPQPPLLAIIL